MVQIQEPPLTIQTTRLLLLPPPSPPKVVTNALQVSSAATRENTKKQEQSVGTPPTIEGEIGKLVEEKEETRDEEKTTIQTLVELPMIGNPIQTLQKVSTNMLAF